MNEIQKLEYDILLSVHSYCVNNDIKYSLAFGTMLGAVRHQGFIPWDDDIDILMVRDQYDKFVNAVKGDGGCIGIYRVLFPGETRYFYPFMKIINPDTIVNEDRIEEKYELGVWIDVFVLDYVNTLESSVLKELNKRRNYCKELLRYVAKDSSRLKKILRLFYLLYLEKIKKHSEENLRNELMSPLPNGDKSNVSVISWITSKVTIYPYRLIKEYMMLKFEDNFFYVFKDFDQILKLQYGDYMKFPPEKQRNTTHGISIEHRGLR